MSLINQVLNQLEQRGAHTSPNQTLIRAVPPRAERHWIKPVLIVTAILVLVMLLWLKTRQPKLEKSEADDGVVTAPAPAPSVPDDLPEPLQPSSKLSMELGNVPLPESLRESKTAKPLKPDSEPAAIVAQSSKPLPTVHKPSAAKLTVAPAISFGEEPLKQVSRAQQADAEYRKALVLQQQGHAVEALSGYEAALKLNAQQDAARLAMAALLMEKKRGADAERVLQDGVKLKPLHTGFSMALARVQVERGRVDQALLILQQNLSQAEDKADYQAFFAALLQREGRHKEAVNHYQIAVHLAPNSGVWLMGYAISLQAIQRIEDAKVVYQQALATKTLTPELTAFVQQKLKGF